MATYDNDLRLKEIATGDESGGWGTSTNTNLSLIADAFGYGSEAISLMKEYAFNRLGMHQLYCSVIVDNTMSVKLFKAAGFKQIGVRKDWCFRNGYFLDVIEFQFLNQLK